MVSVEDVSDAVATFTLVGAPVRGRFARMGAGTIDPILHRHDYPRPVALLLGEALTLVALVGSLLKVEGVLSVQAEGDGPAPLLVAEYRSGGGIRGYARVTDRTLGEARLAPAAPSSSASRAMRRAASRRRTGRALASCSIR